MIRVNAPKIIAEYQLPATGTAAVAKDILADVDALKLKGAHRLVLEAVTERVFFAFGADNTVLADKTVDGTTKKVASGYSVAAGMAIEVDIEPGELNRFCSVQATSSATGIVKVCEPQA